MNLTVDIGNSKIKAAVFDNDQIKQFDWPDIPKSASINKVIISSVADNTKEVKDILKAKGFTSILILTKDTPIPVKNLYKTPETLGNDRIALAVGANHLFPNQHVLIIDTGTCITYDMINNNNEYMGGNISPGIDMRFKALHTFTDQLPLLSKAAIKNVIGKTTNESIVTGVLNGTIAEMRGIINNYKSEFPSLKIVLTGGDSDFFESQLKNKIFAVQNLVLIGLNKILEHNVSHH